MCERIWTPREPLTGHSLHRSEFLSVDQSQQRLFALWTVYQVQSVITRRYSETTDLLGGCHVILLRWRTGVENLSMVIAHAGWPTHVQTPVKAVTVIRMTIHGVKTAVSWLTRQSFQQNSSGLEILVFFGKKVTTRWGNWGAMAQHKHIGITQKKLVVVIKTDC